MISVKNRNMAYHFLSFSKISKESNTFLYFFIFPSWMEECFWIIRQNICCWIFMMFIIQIHIFEFNFRYIFIPNKFFFKTKSFNICNLEINVSSLSDCNHVSFNWFFTYNFIPLSLICCFRHVSTN